MHPFVRRGFDSTRHPLTAMLSIHQSDFSGKVFLHVFLLFLIVVASVSGMIEGTVVSKCDQTTGWTGGVLDNTLKNEGTGSLKWSHGTSAQLIHQVALDLSDSRGISFWMHSNIANGQRFNLILSSENSAIAGADYYLKLFQANFTGWKFFRILKSDLTVARNPLGFDKITGMTLTASGWGNTPNAANVIHVDDVRKIPQGYISACDDLNEWLNGLSVVTSPVKEGVGALLWDQAVVGEIEVKMPPTDFSGQQTLSFWAHSNVANGRKVMVFLGSDHPASPEKDGYYHEIEMNFTGWKKFKLSISNFETAQDPLGLDQINRVVFTSSGWGITPNAGNQIVLDSLEVVPFGANLDFKSAFTSVRPLLFVNDWSSLDTRVSGNVAMQGIETAIVGRANAHLTKPLVQYVIVDGRLLATSREVVLRVGELAYAYRATGNAQYAAKAIAEMEAAAGFSDWHPAHFLDVGEMAFGVALGYDWLHDVMTEPQRTAIRNAIVQKGLQVYLANTNAWWFKTNSNWSGVCSGGIGVAAVAVSDTHPDLAADVLTKAFEGLSVPGGYLEQYAPDGGWAESPAYWEYGTSYFVLLAASLESALGDSYGLMDWPGMSRTGRFPIDMLTSRERHVFHFGDGPTNRVAGPTLFWLGAKFNDPLLKWFQKKYHNSEVFDLLWFDPSGEDPVSLGVELDSYYRGVEAVSFRTAWNDGYGTSLMFKAGDNNVGHSQLDLGEFMLESRNTRWITDLGNENYAKPGYIGGGTNAVNGSRWTYYRARAEANNTMVINPYRLVASGHTGDQDPFAKTVVEKFRSNGAGVGFAIADLTDAYQPYGALSAKRGVAMINGRKRVLVQDEVTMDGTSDYYHFLSLGVPESGVTLSGNTAILSSGSEALKCEILYPAGAVLELQPSVQFAGLPKASEQTVESRPRLAIRLEGVESVVVRVLFTPVLLGGNTFSAPGFYALNDPRWPENMGLDGKQHASEAYDQWALQTMGGYPVVLPRAAADEDWDGDGVSNLLEYAFGTSPSDGNARGAVNISKFVDAAGTARVRFDMQVRPGADVDWVLECSENLQEQSWSEISMEWVEDPNDPSKVMITTEATGADACFYRVRVSLKE